MNQMVNESSTISHDSASPRETGEGFISGFHGVRYQVKDVSGSIAFYTRQLGFKLEMQQLPAFAIVSIGDLKLLLSGPAASGSRPMPDGSRQEPGGWNRIATASSSLGAGRAGLSEQVAHVEQRQEPEAAKDSRRNAAHEPKGNPSGNGITEKDGRRIRQ